MKSTRDHACTALELLYLPTVFLLYYPSFSSEKHTPNFRLPSLPFRAVFFPVMIEGQVSGRGSTGGGKEKEGGRGSRGTRFEMTFALRRA